MEPVIWTDDLATGVAEVDAQHQQLIRLVADFEEAAAAGRGRRALDALLEQLIRYTEHHFADEEALLAAHDYPGLDAHRSIHRQVVQRLERLRLEHEVHGRRITSDMRRFLAYWLREHIMDHDMQFVDHVRGAGRGTEAPDPDTVATG